ncbi:dihydro-p-hydroxycinnamoy-CoA dehydrogenase [Rhodococcus sp. NPDC059968]|uniref:dihydro-p-hydroxycinnamoy-CoA dehydrogenase n=1 Tax=Rhodococcus sp. NPDC059968 TaxID=3347017 RepID=UPI00366C43F9
MSSVALERTIFDADHDAFRETVRRFAERDVAPHLRDWADAGQVDRDVYRQAGKLGLLGINVEERFAGGGIDDFRFNAIVIEELCRVGAPAVVMGLSGINDLVTPYLVSLANEQQKRRFLTPLCTGKKIGAIAMTEPGAGSDLAAISTTALPDGDHLVLNGTKIFISNGMLADFVIVVAKTDPAAGKKGVSLLVVEHGTAGFTRNGPLHKVGLTAQDTAELVFDDVRVPCENVLGELNDGFGYLRHNLPQERLSVAVTSMASMRRTFDQALTYSCDRTAFGQRVADFQANRFYLAELATEIEIAQCFTDRCILDAAHGTLDEVTAAMAKWWITELQQRVVQRAVQLHGGYGYMREYDVAQDYLDCRGGPIYAGTTEIMKEIIGRKLTRA